MSKNLQGRWSQVIRDFLLVVVLICGLRWALAEPFLVPSGSMIPTLLIKDYIVVTKYSFGLRMPFTKTWLVGPQTPKRGDVVVFRSKGDTSYFMVKRVVGLPGDKISIERESKHLWINDQPVVQEPQELQPNEDVQYFEEVLGDVKHTVQYAKNEGWEGEPMEVTVPEGHLFLMGDNRDASSDSRVWGALPLENLLGKAQFIWMSCKEEAPDASVLCLGEDMRQERLFQWVR